MKTSVAFMALFSSYKAMTATLLAVCTSPLAAHAEAMGEAACGNTG